MQFKDYLATFPEIDHLNGLNVVSEQGEIVQHIPAIEGKLGSLKLYNALFEKFGGRLTTQEAQQGLEWFAEHVEDAKNNVGKHPNIDLLIKVVERDFVFKLEPVLK